MERIGMITPAKFEDQMLSFELPQSLSLLLSLFV